MKLLKMTDFVLEQRMTTEEVNKSSFHDIQTHIYKYYDKIYAYANLLKQPLKLEMFVPCDEDGNVFKGKPLSPAPDSEWIRWENEEFEFYKAKEKVLFEGLYWEGDYVIGNMAEEMIYIDEEFCQNMTIEDFLNSIISEIKLTQSAINQINR